MWESIAQMTTKMFPERRGTCIPIIVHQGYVYVNYSTNSVSLKEMASSMRKFEGGEKRSVVQARLYRIFEYLAIVL
jgi:hypothetical protein